MIAPVQLMCGLDSETVAAPGFAPRVLGLIATTTAKTARHNEPMITNLHCAILKVFSAFNIARLLRLE
jgi:hypothetical protein